MNAMKKFATLFNTDSSGYLYTGFSGATIDPVKQQNSQYVPISREKVFGWIEFPVWATEVPQLKRLIESACEKAKECEHNDNVICLYDTVESGHYKELESTFQEHLVPFDCGGKDPVDGASWAGWWRPGHPYPVYYEISSAGEEIVALDDLRSLTEKNCNEFELRQALQDFVIKHDHSPPTKVSEFRSRLKKKSKFGVLNLPDHENKISSRILSLFGLL